MTRILGAWRHRIERTEPDPHFPETETMVTCACGWQGRSPVVVASFWRVLDAVGITTNPVPNTDCH